LIQKKLEGGRVTYREAGLTEDNVKMLKKQFAKPDRTEDTRSSLQKQKGPILLAKREKSPSPPPSPQKESNSSTKPQTLNKQYSKPNLTAKK